jgi:Domain of unknown function (DUF4263)
MADDDLSKGEPGTYKVAGKPWGVAEGERIFLSIRPDADSSPVLRGLDFAIVRNSKDPDATVEITLHHQRRRKTKDGWADEPFLLYNLKANQAIRLPLDSAETLALYRHLQDLFAIGAEGVPAGRRSLQVHDAEAIVATGDLAELLRALVEKHGEKSVAASVGALLPDPVEVLALKREFDKRSAALTEFETHLAWDDWSELEWQTFFRANDWIFGHGLEYHFLISQESEPSYGGEDFTGKGDERGDELMSTAGDWRFAVLVELKTPGAELIGTTRYRNGAWSIGADLSGGVAQVQANCERAVKSSELKKNVRFLDARKMEMTDPKGILLIGKTGDLDNDEKRATFHRFRRNLWNPQVITYDELLAQARFLVRRAGAEARPEADGEVEMLEPEDGTEFDYVPSWYVPPSDDGPPYDDEPPDPGAE